MTITGGTRHLKPSPATPPNHSTPTRRLVFRRSTGKIQTQMERKQPDAEHSHVLPALQQGAAAKMDAILGGGVRISLSAGAERLWGTRKVVSQG